MRKRPPAKRPKTVNLLLSARPVICRDYFTGISCMPIFQNLLAAFAKYRSANELAEKLSKKGYPSYCDFHKPDEGSSFYRVRIGNYGSSAEADRILNKIRKLGYDGFIPQN